MMYVDAEINDYDEDIPMMSVTYNSNWTDDYLAGLDTSQYPFPNHLWHIKSPVEIASKATLVTINSVFGIMLNSVILASIACNKWLWTPSYYLVANLATADLLTLCICPWFMMVRDFYQNYVLGYFGCHFEGFLQGSMILASVGALMLVSYDRLAAAVLKQDARITKSATPKLIIANWLAAFALSLPWVLKRTLTVRLWLDYTEVYCVENVHFLSAYWHVVVVLLVWVPLLLMACTYGAILWRLERSIKQLQVTGTCHTIGRAKQKAMKVTACVLLATVACRIPFTVLTYWRNSLGDSINSVDGAFSIMWFVANFMMYANAALNPLIYGFTNERLRNAMDRTPFVKHFKFGTWCCVCTVFKVKETQVASANTERVFVITNSPPANKKFSYLIKNMLHMNKETFDCSVPKIEDDTNKPTRITPLKPDCN